MDLQNNLEELLKCSICTDIFYEPITLLCQHSFCKKCLDNSNTNKCPYCNLKIFVPPQVNYVLQALAYKFFSRRIRRKKEKYCT